MRKSIIGWTTVLLVLAALSMPGPAGAMMASELKDLKVLSHHFTTRVSSDTRTFDAKDPSQSRFVIFKCSAKIPSDDGTLFLNDFVLRYFHKDGKEDRASAVRICASKTAEIGEESNCLVSRGGWIKVGTGNVYFTIAFMLENDVDKVDLDRVGGTESTHVDVGGDRRFSVHVSTNRGLHSLDGILDTLRGGGYEVVGASDQLVSSIQGVTIHYAKRAEGEAREISQRIMMKTHVAPTVKKNNLVNGDTDIVVWMGK